MLLAAGAEPNVQDALGRTPLHMAQGNTSIVQALMAAGADPSLVDDCGRPAMASEAAAAKPVAEASAAPSTAPAPASTARAASRRLSAGGMMRPSGEAGSPLPSTATGTSSQPVEEPVAVGSAVTAPSTPSSASGAPSAGSGASGGGSLLGMLRSAGPPSATNSPLRLQSPAGNPSQGGTGAAASATGGPARVSVSLGAGNLGTSGSGTSSGTSSGGVGPSAPTDKEFAPMPMAAPGSVRRVSATARRTSGTGGGATLLTGSPPRHAPSASERPIVSPVDAGTQPTQAEDAGDAGGDSTHQASPGGSGATPRRAEQYAVDTPATVTPAFPLDSPVSAMFRGL